MEKLVSKIPEEDIRKILADILESNESLKNRLQLEYDFQMNAHQMSELKKEIKEILYQYSGRGGFIDWQHAYDFCYDMRIYLDEKIPFCYDYWKEVVCKCSESEKTLIERWFCEHKDTDFVIDYMEEYIDEFYEQYFLTEDEVHERMDILDSIIANHKNENDCGKIYSVRHGYKDAILQRLDCMKRLQMSEEDIIEYRTLHRHFFCIRELEITEIVCNI